MSNTVREIKTLVTSEGRVHPLQWHEFFKLIKGAGDVPPPLILGGAHTSDMAKRVRLLQQVDAIRDNREILDSAVHFLSELAAEEWRVVEGELSNVDSYGNEDVPSALYLLMLE